MRVALEYAKKHNMTVELVVNEHEEWGDIYSNWTGTGIVGNLVFDKGDVGFGTYIIFILYVYRNFCIRVKQEQQKILSKNVHFSILH